MHSARRQHPVPSGSSYHHNRQQISERNRLGGGAGRVLGVAVDAAAGAHRRPPLTTPIPHVLPPPPKLGVGGTAPPDIITASKKENVSFVVCEIRTHALADWKIRQVVVEAEAHTQQPESSALDQLGQHDS